MSQKQRKYVVVAPGCADLSEGMALLNNTVAAPQDRAGEEDVTCKKNEQSASAAGGGSSPKHRFLSIAPGAGDLSEGAVWVPVEGSAAHEGDDRDDR